MQVPGTKGKMDSERPCLQYGYTPKCKYYEEGTFVQCSTDYDSDDSFSDSGSGGLESKRSALKKIIEEHGFPNVFLTLTSDYKWSMFLTGSGGTGKSCVLEKVTARSEGCTSKVSADTALACPTK